MRLLSLLAAAAAVSVCVSAPSATALAPPPASTALLKGPNGERIGQVLIQQVPTGVVIDVDVKGLTPGWHGMHIHEKGDCSAVDASSAGGHFNPTAAPHGRMETTPHHAGDMDNIVADGEGVAHVNMHVSGVTLGGGLPTDIAGRALVVHAKADDYHSQPSGDAGSRVACGVITILD